MPSAFGDVRVSRGLAVQGWRCGVAATNARFTGGYAEYAVASATKLAMMPQRMGFIEAASLRCAAGEAGRA
jgi:NADPH:quinone reductase-like Zn-dependent oxidoreductase